MPMFQPPAPERDVVKPGVIATGQRTTPAGVQSVFQGRVGGVRFDAASSTIWVAVPGAVYRLRWERNEVVARHAFNGRPGAYGVAVDHATGRALVSTVGRLPGAAGQSRLPGSPPLATGTAIVQLAAFGGVPAASGALGDFTGGGPAVASRPNASGHRVVVAPLPANDALAVLDADDLRPLARVPLGVVPVAAALSADGASAWVTSLGGAQPAAGQRAARQCCDPRAEPVQVDARGIAARGSVSRVDVVARRVTRVLGVGRHPTAVAWDERRARLYVADGNDDAVHVVDTRADTVAGVIAIAPFRARRAGLAPTALALSPDGGTLYVALGGANAVAVYDVSAAAPRAAALRGLVPTGWYPSTLDASADGRWLAVGTLFGSGSGEGTTDGSPGKRGGYVHAVRGSVHVVAVPGASELAAYTAAVAQNNRLALGNAAEPLVAAPRPRVPARAVPERPGEPSRIDHVVFVVRENRTYDQVLGDLGRGDGDTSLVIYGRDVTPNAHALSEQFVTLDHFFASGGNSADGHQWLTQANETEYPMWPLYQGRSYPSEGNDPLAYSSGGFLWEAAQAKGKTVRVFGEYAPAPSDSIPRVRASLMADWLGRDAKARPSHFRTLLRARYDTRSAIPSLDRALVREYPGWTQEVPDVVKAEVFLDHLREWTAAGAMPNLVMMVLPSDHTVGTNPGWCVPKACVADNDLALGMVVDALTHSPFWKSMAILVVEDDAQDGVDHVDGHRTVALAISPWARRGVVDSTPYAQPSMVKTVELMLGLPALSVFDLTAHDMRNSFRRDGEAPDHTPYTAIVPTQPLDATNLRVGDITGPDAATRRRAALASSRMNFLTPDAAPSGRLNAILWHDARGWRTPVPATRRALFFPLSVDLADDERAERAEREPH